MTKENKWFRFIYTLARVLLAPFIRIRVTGRENIPEGPVIVCAPHSSATDPIYVAFSLTRRTFLHFMAKKELFSIPVLGWIITKIGTISVDRGAADTTAIRNAMRSLKNGEKVGIFPEGTRVSSDEAADAKSGAIKIAAKMNVPILPVYLPRDKKLFRSIPVTIGKAYDVNPDKKKLSNEDYDILTDQLIEKILSLKSVGGKR